MSQQRPYNNSQAEETSLVAYEEPPPPEPDYYYDEPYDYAGRSGVRGEEKEVDYSIYATRKDSVKYRNPDRDRCRKIGFGICLLCCCCLIIGALIAGIVMVLKDQNGADKGATFAPSVSISPTYNPVNPPTFPPTIDTRPTGSARPTITYKPSEIPSTNPTTSFPTTSSQPSADSELLMILGEEDNGDNGLNSWAQFGALTSFIVNDEGVYEFVMDFQHNENLPIGPDNYEGNCQNFESTKIHDYDGRPFREPRKFFKRLPDYVWNATGFQHVSLDWWPCGSYPRNYAHPHYDVTFFRVTPEDRVVYLACKEQKNVQEPDIVRACEFSQSSNFGKEFYILPSSVADRSKVPNMPFNFEQQDFYAPYPYVGMQYHDTSKLPSSPGAWNTLDMGMSTHAGDIMSWKAKIPFRTISGSNPQFKSMTHEYYQTTISTLPDAFSVYYTPDGTIRLQMTGLSAIPKEEVDQQKLLNPDAIPSAPTSLPAIPVCVCNAPDPSPAPSSLPSVFPSESPTIPRFDFCNLLTGNEASTNVIVNCFSTEYECNQKQIKDCHLECGPDQCASSDFDQSYVLCIDETSCNKISSTKPVVQFINSQVLCQVAGACTDAEFLACTCCDGPGCPTEDFVGNALPSCVDGDVATFCNQMIESEGKTCRELGNPVCTNL